MSDQQMISGSNRLSLDNNQNSWDYAPKADGAIEIPVRIGAAPADSVVEDRDEALIREYEERYYGKRSQQQQIYGEMPFDGEKRKRDWSWASARNFKLPPGHRYQTRPQSYVQDNERTWAALAHASALITLITLFSTGPGVVLTLLIPLGIYLFYRRRSEYVAYHALQAFTMQTVATIGAFAILLVGGLILGILIGVSALFSIVLVGIPFLIIFSLMFLVLLGVTLMAPFVMLIYGMIAANAAWNGRNYRYPYVADWVDDQLTNGRLNSDMI